MSSDLEQLVFFDRESTTLLVSRSHAFQPEVRGYQQQLRSQGLVFTVEHVAMDVIEKRRSVSDDGSMAVVERSEMQQIARELFRKAVKQKASDIHIRVSSKASTRVYFRVHSDLLLQEEHPESWGKFLCSAIYTAMSDVSDATYEVLARQDGRISSRDKLPPGLDGIRIATTPQVDGNVMVLRLLYQDANQSNDICTLGFSPQQRSLIDLMKRRPTGINIISGPTGSGKSTTLQRTLLSIHAECKGAKHIITVEDPPEYPMEGIVQTPVANVSTEQERSVAFQEAIKATMRLDPNVIMIGEIRDTPSASLGIQAAMTGHQVWATVHANSALAILDRMVDMDVPINMMCDPTIVTGLVCQRLLKVLCSKCKLPLTEAFGQYSRQDQVRIASVIDINQACALGPGCEHCNGTGISGRTVVAEVIVPDENIGKLMKQGEKGLAIEYWRAGGGMSILSMAIEKIKSGMCDPLLTEEEVGPLDFSTKITLGANNERRRDKQTISAFDFPERRQVAKRALEKAFQANA